MFASACMDLSDFCTYHKYTSCAKLMFLMQKVSQCNGPIVSMCVSVDFIFIAHNPSLDCVIVLLSPNMILLQMIIFKSNNYFDQPQQYLNVAISPAVVLV